MNKAERMKRMLSSLKNDIILMDQYSKNLKRQYKTLKRLSKTPNKIINKRLKNKFNKLIRLNLERKELQKILMDNKLDGLDDFFPDNN
ncbi:hypothetical protein LCGC14_1084280 [marine sediment metagenome]|uniref:Uncharacterized protein n=1 Tax=marine sediment metagenome TaxID=412755 RepID=A0A0F9MIS7_9ZZZZ